MPEPQQPLRLMRPLRAELLTPFEHNLLGGTPEANAKGKEMHRVEAVILQRLTPREAVRQRQEFDYIESALIGTALGLGGPLRLKFSPIDPETGMAKADSEVGVWDKEHNVLRTVINGRDIRQELIDMLRKDGKEIHSLSEILEQEGSQKSSERE